MTEFQISKFLSLKLEKNETIIYVKNEKFRQCKSLLLNINIDEIKSFDEIESIDEASERLDRSFELNIPPEVEFWGHCSNLQVWVENNYDTRLLHRDLAFPLLKKLVEIGDNNAKKVFKEEIIKRLAEGNSNVIIYLTLEQYIDHISESEWEVIVLDSGNDVIRNLIINLDKIFREEEETADYIVDIIQKLCKNEEIKEVIHKIVYDLILNESDSILVEIVSYQLYKVLEKKEIKFLINSRKSKLKRNLEKILFGIDNNYSKNDFYVFYSVLLFLYNKLEEKDLIENFSTYQKNLIINKLIKYNDSIGKSFREQNNEILNFINKFRNLIEDKKNH